MNYDKLSRLIFPFSVIACAVLRVFLKLTAIDPSTGFYHGGGAAVLAQNLILAVCAIALFLLGSLQKTEGRAARYTMPQRVFALLTALAALPLAYFSILDQLDGFASMDFDLTPLLLAVKLLVMGVVFLCTTLAPLISVWFFIQIFLKARADSGEPCVGGYLALFPLAWQVAVLLRTFMSYTALRSVSDQMLTIVMLILLAPFLLANGRVLAGVSPSRGLRQLAAFGTPFSLLAITVSLGVIAAAAAGRPVEIALSLPNAFFYLMLGCYAAVFTWNVKE